MVCKKCGKEIAEGAKFCCECGEPVGELCNACSAIIPDGAKYCPFCGKKQNLLDEGSLIKWNPIQFKDSQGFGKDVEMSWDVIKCKNGKALLLSHTAPVEMEYRYKDKFCFHFTDSAISKMFEDGMRSSCKDIVITKVEPPKKYDWDKEVRRYNFFLLSEEEFNTLVPDHLKSCKSACWTGWWLRDCFSEKDNYGSYRYEANVVMQGKDGEFKKIEKKGANCEFGVRPAVWVDIEKMNEYLATNGK